MPGSNVNDRIFAVILAGGTASRFGRLKQIEPVGGTCLLGIVVGHALDCGGIEKVILVLGHEASAVEKALGETADHKKLKIVVNDEYRDGLSTSLRTGLAAAQSEHCDAVIFLLGDMPMIDTGLLDTMIDRYRSSSCALCYLKMNDRPGHPIIARKDLFGEFVQVKGDIGGREIVRRYAAKSEHTGRGAYTDHAGHAELPGDDKHAENARRALAVEIGHTGDLHQLDINDINDLETYLSITRRRDDA
jgi:molybdenum cofactor cytidylyltransferase